MKQVTFGDSKVHVLVTWSFAYRKARENIYGPMAVDRMRFQRRIKLTEILLNNILTYKHRCKIYECRFLKHDTPINILK